MKALRLPGESFTDVVNRMTRNRGVLELAGVLSAREASRMTEEINKLRRKSSKRAEQTVAGMQTA